MGIPANPRGAGVGAGAGARGGATRATTGPTSTRPTSADLIACPECGVTAEVLDRFTLDSTAGPVEHLRIACLSGHHFLMPAG